MQCFSRLHTPCSDAAVAAFLFLVKKVPEDASMGFPDLPAAGKNMKWLFLCLCMIKESFAEVGVIPRHEFRVSSKLLLYWPTER